jgi:hypothetical protein
MEKGQKNVLNAMMMLSGALISGQCILRAGDVRASLLGLGVLSPSLVPAFIAVIFILSFSISFSAFLYLLPNLAPRLENNIELRLFLLTAGFLSTVGGLAIINLSGATVNGFSITFTLLVGMQLFSLGVLALSSSIMAMGDGIIVKKAQWAGILLFVLLLLPAAFLIGE